MVLTGLSLLQEQGGYCSLAGRIKRIAIPSIQRHGFRPSKNNDDFDINGPPDRGALATRWCRSVIGKKCDGLA
jgi:hypothetical protein